MKKIFEKPVALATLLFVLYLIGLILSTFTIISYPLSRQEMFHIAETKEITDRYLQSSDESFFLWLSGKLSGKSQFLIYNTAGNRLLDRSSGSGFHIHYEAYLPKVLTGNEIYTLKLAREDIPTIHNLMGVVGIPIVENGTITGAAFMAKKTIAVTESLAGYAIYFTLLFWLSAFFIVSNIRRKKRLEQLQQNYIANVTHALKTPVASIKALSETLCDEVEPDPDKQKVYYGMILREANRQDHMIRDILELSKLQSNGMDFSKTKLSAAELFAPIRDKYTTLCDCMDIHLHISDSFSRLPTLYSNAACIRQIFEILLDNALKFVSENGNIWIDASVSGKAAVFCVRDDGVGIEKETLPQVFDRFFKGSHDFNSSGSGLGLAIAKEITAGLKERIWVESETGKGSSFFFTVHLK